MPEEAALGCAPPRGDGGAGELGRPRGIDERHVRLELAAGVRWKALDQRQLERSADAENSAHHAPHALDVFRSRPVARPDIEAYRTIGALDDLVLRHPCCFALSQMHGDGVRVDPAPLR